MEVEGLGAHLHPRPPARHEGYTAVPQVLSPSALGSGFGRSRYAQWSREHRQRCGRACGVLAFVCCSAVAVWLVCGPVLASALRGGRSSAQGGVVQLDQDWEGRWTTEPTTVAASTTAELLLPMMPQMEGLATPPSPVSARQTDSSWIYADHTVSAPSTSSAYAAVEQVSVFSGAPAALQGSTASGLAAASQVPSTAAMPQASTATSMAPASEVPRTPAASQAPIFSYTASSSQAPEILGTTSVSEPFDCAAGYNAWRRGWSEAKKHWCCVHMRLACVEVQATQTTTFRTTTEVPSTSTQTTTGTAAATSTNSEAVLTTTSVPSTSTQTATEIAATTSTNSTAVLTNTTVPSTSTHTATETAATTSTNSTAVLTNITVPSTSTQLATRAATTTRTNSTIVLTTTSVPTTSTQLATNTATTTGTNTTTVLTSTSVPSTSTQLATSTATTTRSTTVLTTTSSTGSRIDHVSTRPNDVPPNASLMTTPQKAAAAAAASVQNGSATSSVHNSSVLPGKFRGEDSPHVVDRDGRTENFAVATRSEAGRPPNPEPSVLPRHDPFEWVGCFLRSAGGGGLMHEPPPETPTSTAVCNDECRGFAYMLLRGATRPCQCDSGPPADQDAWEQVWDGLCGPECAGESGSSPVRLCGSVTAHAVYKLRGATTRKPGDGGRPNSSEIPRSSTVETTQVAASTTEEPTTTKVVFEETVDANGVESGDKSKKDAKASLVKASTTPKSTMSKTGTRMIATTASTTRQSLTENMVNLAVRVATKAPTTLVVSTTSKTTSQALPHAAATEWSAPTKAAVVNASADTEKKLPVVAAKTDTASTTAATSSTTVMVSVAHTMAHANHSNASVVNNSGNHTHNLRITAVGKSANTTAGHFVPAQRTNKSSIMKGICYSPVPLKSKRQIVLGKALPDDDFMSENASVLWGPHGRGDLALIRSMGANTVRLYGNDPSLDHSAFLAEAEKHDLQIIVGISDYPYTQMPGNCVQDGSFDCYHQVKQSYLANLQKGFLTKSGQYRKVLRSIILMNEPDLKIHRLGSAETDPARFCKVMLSAMDAVLDAEEEMHVKGPRPNLTVTMSFGVCPACGKYGSYPAIGQMDQLRHAFRHPSSVQYTPRRKPADLWKAYATRFENSVNTNNPVSSFKRLFQARYDKLFPGVPVILGEYHSPDAGPEAADQRRDLEELLDLAYDGSSMLAGVNFFEFQVRYDKGGGEMAFGAFGLGNVSHGNFTFRTAASSATFEAWCLTPMRVPQQSRECGPVELGVSYLADPATWGYEVNSVYTPKECCRYCSQSPSCRAWTWEKKAELGFCRLHGKRPAATAAVQLNGAVSGLPVGPVRHIPKEDWVSTAVARAFGVPNVNSTTLCPASGVVFVH